MSSAEPPEYRCTERKPPADMHPENTTPAPHHKEAFMSSHEIKRRDFVTAGLAAGAAVGALSVLPGNTLAAGSKGPQLTLHAIDTYFGQTKAGLRIDLSRLDGGSYKKLLSVRTVARGRTKHPLLIGSAMLPGKYELLMHLDDYFAKERANLPKPPFLGKVPIRFGVAHAHQRYHVPILFSPWSYSYYRGS